MVLMKAEFGQVLCLMLSRKSDCLPAIVLFGLGAQKSWHTENLKGTLPHPLEGKSKKKGKVSNPFLLQIVFLPLTMFSITIIFPWICSLRYLLVIFPPSNPIRCVQLQKLTGRRAKNHQHRHDH